jgi:hypothetical protein
LFDRRASGISEPDQVCRFVERFAGGVVQRRPEPTIASDTEAGEQLAMPARNKQQQKREIQSVGQPDG